MRKCVQITPKRDKGPEMYKEYEYAAGDLPTHYKQLGHRILPLCPIDC